MKQNYKSLQNLGTLSCTLSMLALYSSVLTSDWLTLEEPQVDQNELDKLGPYDDDPKPYLLKAKFGLFKVCVFNVKNKNDLICYDLQIIQFFQLVFNGGRRQGQQVGQDMVEGEEEIFPTQLIANCVRNMRFTLPFIGLSVLFTSAAFLSLTFGHFCQKNKKIIEASFLILGGLCQATALLTFVSRIGSDFEANSNLEYTLLEDSTSSSMPHYYRYKYGYSFYLFLLSFSLSELAALFDMAAYFRKYPNNPNSNKYIITFQGNVDNNDSDSYVNNTLRKGNNPDICTSSNNGNNTSSVEFNSTMTDTNIILPPPQSYLTDHVITIENCCNNPYATIRNQQQGNQQQHHQFVHNTALESFATLSRNPNSAMNPMNFNVL